MNSEESLKLYKFSEAVYSEVDGKINAILSEAALSKDKLLDESNDEGLALAYEKIKLEKKKIENKYVKLASSAELDAKRRVLIHREKLAAQVFENLRYDLIEFTKSADYLNWLKVRLTECPSDKTGVISVGCADENKLPELLKSAKGCTGEVDKTILIGGFTVYYEQDGIVIDKTLDTMLKDSRDEFNQGAYLKITD